LAVLAEYKYDGQRAQIHITAAKQVRIFSRNSEDRTAAFPDVCSAVLAAADQDQLPLVFDAELVAVDRSDDNRVRAFQELAARPRGPAGPGPGAAAAVAAAQHSTGGTGGSSGGGQRQTQQQQTLRRLHKQQKLDAAAAQLTLGGSAASNDQQQQQQQSSSVEVCVFVFDVLCVAGEDLMSHPFRERRAAAGRALPHLRPGVVQMAEGVEVLVGGAAARAGTEGSPPPPAAAAAAEEEEEKGGICPAEESGPTAPATEAGSAAVAAAVGIVGTAEQAVTDFFFNALAAGSEGLMLKLLDGPGG
jgi:DNA ligase-1